MKLQKTSWKFPEFLQRHRSIDQNNQEERSKFAKCHSLDRVFYFSKQNALMELFQTRERRDRPRLQGSASKLQLMIKERVTF